MVAKLGSDEALGKALRRGDVVEVKDKGRTYYAWQEISVTRSTGTKEQFSVYRQTYDPIQDIQISKDAEMVVVREGKEWWHPA